MKVGIWLDAEYTPEEGGGYSYYDKLVKAIDAYPFDSSVEVCFVTESHSAVLHLQRSLCRLTHIPNISIWKRIKKRFSRVCQNELIRENALNKQIRYRQILKDNGIDVIYYLRQSECHISNYPFIATNWDIGHSSTYAFPEVAMDGQFESRNHFYTNILPKALFVFAESEAGKQELLQYTRISEDKIKVVPIFAGNCVEDTISEIEQQNVLEQYSLIQYKYFFYPAQFWAHKNHYGLLCAFAKFHQNHPEYKLVLTGSDKGNLLYIKSLVEKLDLIDSVVFPGFVPTSVINTFYKQSTSLVMASFFGPTNMPPIEAMQLGCPVVCSDISGHREILGDAALYFDPADTQSIVDAMEQISKERESYVKLLKEQNIKSKFIVDSALQSINSALVQLVPIRSTWQ